MSSASISTGAAASAQAIEACASSSSSSSSPSSHATALVIGGGIAGCAMALFLKKVGIDAQIFEAYPEGKTTWPGGMQLAPNGMHVLKQLGLDEALAARGTVVSSYQMKNHLNEVLSSLLLDGKGRWGSDAICVSRLNLHRTLVEGITAAGIQIQYQKRLVSISQSASAVIVTFEDGTSAEGAILIGADGVHSRTRHQILPNAPGPFFLGLIGYGGYVPLEFLKSVPASLMPIRGSMNFHFGPKGFFGMAYGGKDDEGRETLMWWSNQPVGEPGGDGVAVKKILDARSNEDIKEELHALHKGWVEPLCSALISNDSVHPPRRVGRQLIHDMPDLPIWYSQRVILIGDAAHAMSPNSGQGASQALEDTMQLAKLLRDAKFSRSSSVEQVESVFQQFQSLRKPRVDDINAAARKIADKKTKTLGPWACWIRDRFLKFAFWMMGDKPFAKYMGYKIRWEEGEQEKSALAAEGNSFSQRPRI